MSSSSLSLNTTYFTRAAGKLSKLTAALQVDEARTKEMIGILRLCMMPWGYGSIGKEPAFLSDITDDHSPFEFSVGYRKERVDLRLLVEAQPVTPRIGARWAAGRQLLNDVEREYRCSLERFRCVEEVFRPTDEWARFALWFAVNLGTTPSFKAYMNPAAHGRVAASKTVREALAALSMSSVWDCIPQLRRGFDEIRYFSLDLRADATARVKIYFAHSHVGADFIEDVLSRAPGHVPGQAREFCRALSGGMEHYDKLPVITCYSFIAGRAEPEDAALHFPVRSYAENDAEAVERTCDVLPLSYRRIHRASVESLAANKLVNTRGVQTYAAMWAKRGLHEVTTYLSPHLYGSASK